MGFISCFSVVYWNITVDYISIIYCLKQWDYQNYNFTVWKMLARSNVNFKAQRQRHSEPIMSDVMISTSKKQRIWRQFELCVAFMWIKLRFLHEMKWKIVVVFAKYLYNFTRENQRNIFSLVASPHVKILLLLFTRWNYNSIFSKKQQLSSISYFHMYLDLYYTSIFKIYIVILFY